MTPAAWASCLFLISDIFWSLDDELKAKYEAAYDELIVYKEQPPAS